MRFIKTETTCRGLIDWNDDGREFHAIEIALGSALKRLSEIEPGWINLLLTSNHEKVRELAECFLNTPTMKFDGNTILRLPHREIL